MILYPMSKRPTLDDCTSPGNYHRSVIVLYWYEGRIRREEISITHEWFFKEAESSDPEFFIFGWHPTPGSLTFPAWLELNKKESLELSQQNTVSELTTTKRKIRLDDGLSV